MASSFERIAPIPTSDDNKIGDTSLSLPVAPSIGLLKNKTKRKLKLHEFEEEKQKQNKDKDPAEFFTRSDLKQLIDEHLKKEHDRLSLSPWKIVDTLFNTYDVSVSFSNILLLNNNEFIVSPRLNRRTQSTHKDIGIYKYNFIDNKWSLYIAYPKIYKVNMENHHIAIDYDKQIIYINIGCQHICKCHIQTKKYEWIEIKTKFISKPKELSWNLSAVINGEYHIFLGSDNNTHLKYNDKQQKYDIMHEFKEFDIDKGLISYGMVYNSLDKYYLLFGGYKGKGLGRSDAIYKYYVSKQKWDKLDIVMPDKMQSFGSVITPNCKYVLILGGSNSKGFSNKIYYLNLLTMKWNESKILCPLKHVSNNHVIITPVNNKYINLVNGYIRNIKLEIPLKINKSIKTYLNYIQYLHVLQGSYLHVIADIDYIISKQIMPQLDSKEEEEDDFFAPKPLFGDDNDLGVIVSNAKRSPEHKEDYKSNAITDDADGDSEDDCDQEACIIDDNGHVTAEDYTLTKKDFKDWSINKITKKSGFDSYLHRTSKQLDESTPFWQFLKGKYSNKYEKIKDIAKQKVDKMSKTDGELIKSMSFDEISAIYLYTTNTLYRELNASLRERKDEFAIFCGPLISGVSKLPFEWKPLYRGVSFQGVVDRIRSDIYEKGVILRWDSYSSTSVNLKVAKGFAGPIGAVFEIANGFRGRDINKFSRFESESEVLFNISSHFVLTKKYSKPNDKRIYVKIKEIPFPWDARTILWVDDKPTNNKKLIEKLERKGIMVIPRISTKGAIEFLDFMSGAITLSAYGQFRVITDMHRFEYEDDDVEEGKKSEDKEAGITLIEELRKRGYDNIVCIYCGRKKETLEKCEARKVYDKTKVKITTSEIEVVKYGSFGTDFSGNWILKTNENLDNFLKAEGISFIKRKYRGLESITLNIKQNGDILKVKVISPMGEVNEELRLDGSEKEMINPMKQKIKVIAHWSDNTREILVIRTHNLETNKVITLNRSMPDENTLQDVSVNQQGIKMVRTFKRK